MVGGQLVPDRFGPIKLFHYLQAEQYAKIICENPTKTIVGLIGGIMFVYGKRVGIIPQCSSATASVMPCHEKFPETRPPTCRTCWASSYAIVPEGDPEANDKYLHLASNLRCVLAKDEGFAPVEPVKGIPFFFRD